MKHMNLTLLGISLFVTFGLPAGVLAQQSYTEDFTTTTYKDALNTTAWWDTATGELKLFPFVPSLLGTYDTPGEAYDVRIEGDYAFVADGNRGLQILDISDPTNPTLIVTCDTPGSARGVAVSGYYAFVADDNFGLQVIDILSLTNPTLAGTYDTPGSACGVTIAGDHAFVADGGSGLQVIDISDPANPTLLGNYDTPGNAMDVTVAGDHAFLADFTYGLQVLDISDPANPLLVGTYNTIGRAWGVTVSGDHAFVADDSFGLQVIDISDPANPLLIGTYNTPGYAYGVAVSGDHAYVADYLSGLQVIDISDPANPTFLDNCDTPGSARGVAISGDHAYVADYGSGLQVIHISDPVDPVVIGRCAPSGQATCVAVSGDHAFMATTRNGLKVIDISDPTNPTLAGACDMPNNFQDITVSGDYAFVADEDSGLNVMDISDPTNPTLVGTCATPGFCHSVTVSGDHAFIADGSFGLQVIDISDPTNPTLAGSYDTPGSVYGVAVSGDHAFVVGYDSGFLVIDISDPTNPWFMGHSLDPLDGATDIVVSGKCAFVACKVSLYVVAINLPWAPSVVAGCVTSCPDGKIAVSGDRAFIAGGVDVLSVVDISDLAHPTFLGLLDTPGSANGLTIAGDHVFLASGYEGLTVMQVFQSEVVADLNLGRSLVVDSGTGTIVRARLASQQTAGVTWELAANGGTDWIGAIPDNTWARAAVPGSDLLWRSTHIWAPGLNPTVSDLTLEWLNDFAPITAISDVPGDQGGYLSLQISRSGYDFNDETALPVTGYQVYRRVDDSLLLKRIVEDGDVIATLDQATPGLIPFQSTGVRRLDGRQYLLASDEAAKSTLPAGTWEMLTWVAAQQVDDYLVTVPSLGDSTAQDGVRWTVFLTTTHTTSSEEFYVSSPDSGYSIDNIAPNAPTDITADYQASGAVLDWDDAPEADFQCYCVYRGTDPGFAPSPDNLVQKIAVSAWTDPEANPWDFHYKITTLDFAGNESEAAAPAVVSGVGNGAVPTRTVLLGAVPNPFNPQTTIAFELPEQGAVTLQIFDLGGRLVRVLVDGEVYPNGRQEAVWNGRDDTGRQLASGTYFYRLEAGGYSETKRMVLIK